MLTSTHHRGYADNQGKKELVKHGISMMISSQYWVTEK